MYVYDLCETRLRGQVERGQGHNTNEVEAEASCSEAEARFLWPRGRELNIRDSNLNVVDSLINSH